MTKLVEKLRKSTSMLLGSRRGGVELPDLRTPAPRVRDAIELTPVPMEPVDLVTDTTESERRVSGALARNRELGEGLRIGKAFKIQSADGAAWYEVTRVDAHSVDVEWRDFGLDRSMDEMLAAGGTFPRGVIERLLQHHETLEDLFGPLA